MPLRELINENKVTRRDIRRHLFKIRNGVDLSSFPEYATYTELKTIIELQFVDEMNWENFTYEWDVSAKDYLKVINKYEWDGRFDKFLNRCDPSAFTKQEM